MRFGTFMFCTDETMDPADVATEVEAAGFESFFVPEHTHIPTSRESPYPSGGELPREYARTYDPFVALAGAAAVTNRLLLGFGICLVVERDPIVTAKAVASLDRLSNGRVLLGIGGGWNREEMRDHGTDPTVRFDVLAERVLAMRRIWTDEVASFDGTHVSFPDMWSWPKPIQDGGPPVLIGGAGAKTFDRVLAYGDGWMPVGWREVDELEPRIRELRRRAEVAGKPRPSITIFGALPEPSQIEAYLRLEVDRVLFRLPSAGSDEVLQAIDGYAQLVERVTPFNGA